MENHKIQENIFEFNVKEEHVVIIKRELFGHTERDIEIHSLTIPKNPKWLNIIVRALRFYQNNISKKLGNRCVFDPSCSRYSEMAFRKKGFLKGTQLTIKRLYKCRPSNGGLDPLR